MVLLSAFAACSSNPVASGSLLVEVKLEAGLTSRCVKVTVTDGVLTRESEPMVLRGKSSPLRIAVLPQGMYAAVTAQAVGYADEACTQVTVPIERSESVEGEFTTPTSTVTLVLGPTKSDAGVDAGLDAGSDAGVDAGVDGGFDGGFDAGIDADFDGYPAGDDCDDTRADVNPGRQELCSDGVDNNCDTFADCAQRPFCDGMACLGNGMCSNGVCHQPQETMCNDGFDNDNDGAKDCEDGDCVGLLCDDGSGCTSGETCGANDGGCTPMLTVTCNTPGVCEAPAGVCEPDGGMCRYTKLNAGGCNDGFACTVADSCAAGVCSGSPVSCPAANQCQINVGCLESLDGGCLLLPVDAGIGCSDGLNCTLNDRCDGDGGCIGDQRDCSMPPSPCHAWDSTCSVQGDCNWSPTTGASCDAGTGVPGTCIGNFVCAPAALFPYTPSNFTEAQLPSTGANLVVTGNATINTDTFPPTVTSGTLTLPPSAQLDGGQPVVLFRIDTLTVNAGVTLTLTGSRPVIFAVTGAASIEADGGIITRAGFGSADCGNGGAGTEGNNCERGSGGGGFGTQGGLGGTCNGAQATAGVVNGSDALVPLRGGCRGGDVNSSARGGLGGGALQLSVAGALTINGRIGAPGRGGVGAPGGDNGGGGGGSGGALLLEADTLSLLSLARVTANGGGGGEGSSTGGGNAGDDGSSVGEAPAPGGNGATNGGDGAAGATRTAGAGNGNAGNNSNNDGSGGGGGGVGRIRFNARTSCTVAGIVSPVRTNGGAASCP